MDHSRHPRSGSGSALKSRHSATSTGARLRRWLSPPRKLRPTAAGWCFFALVVGVGFAALNTGNNLLYLVLSLMLSFLILSGAFSESALRGIQIKRRVPRDLFAQADNPVALHISNSGRRYASLAIAVEDFCRDRSGEETPCGRCFTLRVGPGETDVRSYRLRPEQRGDFHFAGFRVSTRFPFGLFSKSMKIEAPLEALVYPAIESLAIPEDFGRVENSGDTRSIAHSSGTLAAGLREFQPGDATRRVHWRASLRSRRLLVRELESERESEVEVWLRTRGTRPGEEFERAVRNTASEVVALLETGNLVGLRTDSEHFRPGRGLRQRTQLLSFLALVTPDKATEMAQRESA